MTLYSTIILEKHGAATHIILNRPEVYNAFNQQCLSELLDAFDSISKDVGCRVVVVRSSSPKAFSAGADLHELASYGPRDAETCNRMWLAFFDAIEHLPKPVIAEVHGWAPGGGTELSLCCDFVICSSSAKFALAEIKLGVIPGAGAAVRITRWVGRLKAKEILMLGDTITGKEAVAIGLANRCVEATELRAAVDQLVERLVASAPRALAAAKMVVNFASEAPAPIAIESALKEFMLLFATKDQKEGMIAFLEKREPNFTGD